MRTLLAFALVLVACGRADRSELPAAHGASPSSSYRGPDPLVLRFPRAGGPVQVFAYPNVDSLVWSTSEEAPAINRVLGFDADAGLVTFVDSRGRPARIDFRLGTVTTASSTKLTDMSTENGSTVYGITSKGTVVRLTPTGDWSLKPPRPADAAFPQSDGSLVVLAGNGESSTAWKVRPPENTLVDSVTLPAVQRTVNTRLGDRVYLVLDRALIGLRTRTLEELPPIRLERPITALVATPSGDRLFAATDSASSVTVIDRYRGEVSATIELPGIPEELRVDPLGRYLLVHSQKSDSVWVVAIGTDRLVGSVRTAWRPDVPFVAPDGAIALAQGKDIIFVDGATLARRDRVAGGASDFWYSFLWTGFRPRDAALDQPAEFDTVSPLDSLALGVDTAFWGDTTGGLGRDTSAAAVPSRGFVVSFAALLSESSARTLAAQITVAGENARVLTSNRDGTMIYRVVLGPYPTHDMAERVGRESGQSYWVYEAAP